MRLQNRINKALLGLVTLAVVLAACAPTAAQPVPEESTDVPTAPPTTSTELPPAAVLEAQKWLAAHLGVPVEEVELVAQEQVEWPNGCLGVAQAGEACTEAIVPGWRVTLAVAGQNYEVRTDETGSIVRLVPAEVDSELSGTAWVLEAFENTDGAVPVAVPGGITLEFQPDGQAGGSGGCNGYGGAYQAQDGVLSFGEIASTLMLCADEDLMGQEQRYFEALRSASAYALNGDRLTITHANGTLSFTRRTAEGEMPGTENGQARLPGIIDFYADGSEGVLTAPDTVTAGEEFEITIATFGGGCETVGDTAVVVSAAGADVWVYDFTTATQPEVACEDILRRLTHTVTLRFDQPGERVLRVWGRRVGPETPGLGVPTVLEQTFNVQ